MALDARWKRQERADPARLLFARRSIGYDPARLFLNGSRDAPGWGGAARRTSSQMAAPDTAIVRTSSRPLGDGFRDLVEDVGGLVKPAPLVPRAGEDLVD